jgi:hypothetical protein
LFQKRKTIDESVNKSSKIDVLSPKFSWMVHLTEFRLREIKALPTPRLGRAIPACGYGGTLLPSRRNACTGGRRQGFMSVRFIKTDSESQH